ncbi:MAG: AAA family ATPase, partial [Deltaproteobacteria bacterium]|nr:AAA family ATPase [Deltaproteobacteria bacterium]
RGRLNQALERLREIDQISLQDFASSCREGRDSLVQKYGIMPSQAKTLASAPLDVILELQELELPPKTNVELNIAGENQEPIWQRLEDLSTGQKATALLFLLLLRSEAPLLIDQPEDDLDNRFITEGIVPKMREEKRQRQFVFSTHNANIPVLGDAELIIGLSVKAEGGKLKGEISPEHIGSIDDPSVKSLVEEVLEGGREAFEVRRIKYGF